MLILTVKLCEYYNNDKKVIFFLLENISYKLLSVFFFQPLSRSLNADVPEQLITPLVSWTHIYAGPGSVCVTHEVNRSQFYREGPSDE